ELPAQDHPACRRQPAHPRIGRLPAGRHRHERRLVGAGHARSAPACPGADRRASGAGNYLRDTYCRGSHPWAGQGGLRLSQAVRRRRMQLDGKVALITGAASGIGHEIAKRYVAAGGRVVIADLNEDGAVAAAKQLGGAKEAIGVGMDVSKEDQVNDGVARAVKAFGTVDILISNAGIQIVHPIEEFPFADWKKLLAIHLDGAFLTTKACVKHMYKQNSGALIYMGSV